MSAKRGFKARLKSLVSKGPNDTEHLCDVCKKIPFTETEQNLPREKTVFSLGTLVDLRARSSCRFCMFVLASVQDERVIHLRPVSYYESHEIRVFRQGPRKYSIQPLPSYSEVLYDSEVKGLEQIASAEQVDPALMKTWLSICENGHEKCKRPLRDLEFNLARFRAIDVRRLCIAELPLTSPYVTLSYVWGAAPTYKLLDDNKETLMSRSGLETCWDEIPLTVRDSIELIRRLDLQYLWVDALCLIQDDLEDMAIGINAMDLIYEQSVFTLVAASGTDANFGLPGVRPNSRQPSFIRSEISPGINLVLRHTMEDVLNKSWYHHRAWTFQEYYLSRRKLIFLDNTVFFKCHEKHWAEVVDGLQVRPDPTAQQGQVLHKPEGDTFHLLGQLLVKYSTRQLSFPADYVKAMAGICRRISDQVGCPSILGIPVTALDWFILYYPNADGGLKRREGFPSWAWSGWYGSFYYNYGSGNVAKWLNESTWIVWYKRESSGCVSLVRDPEEIEEATQASRLSSKDRASARFAPLCETSATVASEDLPSGTGSRPYTMLQFWTVSTCYTLRRVVDQEEGSNMTWSFGLYWINSTYEVLGTDGTRRGTMTLDNVEGLEPSYEMAELILLSESPKKSKPTGDSDAKFYWALYIVWNDGVAERRGIGKVYRDALASSLEPGPVWKEIVLG